MNADLKTGIGRLAARFDAMTQRERALIAVALVAFVAIVGKGLLVDSVQVRLTAEERRAAQQKSDLSVAEATLANVRAQLAADPDAGTKVRLSNLKAEVAATDAQLQELEDRLVQPERMNALLDRMLAGHAGLRLLAFKSLAPVDLAAPPAPENAKAAPAADAGGRLSGLYRHGVELLLEGGYAELHAWLTQMESAPQGLLWGDVRFEAGESAKHRLTVTVFTLSVDKAWLAI